MKKYIVILLVLVAYTQLFAGEILKPQLKRVDPPYWWTGMEDTSLQLCIYGKNIGGATVTLGNYPNRPATATKIVGVKTVENPNYLFVDLIVAKNSGLDGFKLVLHIGKDSLTYDYALLPKDKSGKFHNGYDSKDLVYLIMPDRFANGNTKDDVQEGMLEHHINRDSIFHRHGGDIAGVIHHLDYLKDLGVTALWLTPVQENNQPSQSYHGYAFTDHYKIDPRLGDLDLYLALVRKSHATGLKVIMDMVYNHIGDQHWFYKDLPSKDWVHPNKPFVQTNYRATALMDPYASDFDKDKMSNGWFTEFMPDLNQQNPLVAKYLIQNSIWWIETCELDGFRIDTYSYSDLAFMANLLAAIKHEYPNFNAVGELWEHGVAIEAYFMQHPKLKGMYETNLPGLTDFQLYDAINEALTKPMDWTGGLARVYYTLAQDFLYSDANRNLTFLDNHDLSRFYSVIGEDINKYKMGIGFLLTTRGIPSLYYGTEILMKNFSDPDGKVREDFPGGWPKDKKNKFTVQGRSNLENEAFDFTRKLANYRKSNPVLQTGKLTQFVPENNTYVYFRTLGDKTVMVVMYYNDKPGFLILDRFAEKLIGHKTGKNIISDKAISLNSPMPLTPNSIQIIELD